jgi:LDH2 family malate/lactate/ureidoglycolate dehydrogenase
LNSDKDIIIRADKIKNFNKTILKIVHVPGNDAVTVAESLVQADLRGVNTHGAVRMPIYVNRLRKGIFNPTPDIRTIHESQTTAIVDGDFGLGQVVGSKAMQLAIKKADTSEVGIVGVKNSHHFGAAAYYSMMALTKDMIGFACSNQVPLMPAPGGAKKVVGNNPFSFAIPAGKELPIVFDMACSVAAQGKIIIASKRGESIPEGWATDCKGIPTTKPFEALEGFLLPVGGHKGYGLALIVDILSGILSGATLDRSFTDMTKNFINDHFFMAIKINNFLDPSLFKVQIDNRIKEIKNSPLAPGVKEVFLPGEIEFRTADRRKGEGIPYPHAVVEELLKMAEEFNLDGKELLGLNEI